jgi:DNA-binding transcriptional LysR family regulator
LRLELNLQDSRTDIIGEGYDLAIRGSDRLEDSSLVARELTTMTHVLCGAPAYFAAAGRPAQPEDLKRHNCVQFTLSGHANKWTFSRAGRSVAVAIDGRYKVSSSIAVRDALLAGFGLSLVPRIYVEQQLAEGRLEAVLGDWEADRTSVYAVYPSRHLAAKTRAFVDFLVERFLRLHCADRSAAGRWACAAPAAGSWPAPPARWPRCSGPSSPTRRRAH